MLDVSRSAYRLAELRSLIQQGRKITYGIVQPGDFVADGVKLVRGGDYSGGWCATTEIKMVRQEIAAPYKRSKLSPGDILVTIVGANTGTVAVVPDALDGANITQTTARVAIDPKHADPWYVEQVLRSEIGAHAVYRTIKGGAQPGLNLADLEKFQIPLPPLPEQRRIAGILRTWDEAIDAASRLIDAKRRRLDLLRANLLTPVKRGDGWRMVRLGDLTAEGRERNEDAALGRERVMGVSNARGVVPMRDATIASDLARYKLLPPHGFAYNPMRINVGSIAMSALDAPVLVSPDYVVFTCRPKALAPGYLDHFRRTRFWNHYVNAMGSGSVRVRIYYGDLADIEIPVPGLAEQKRILGALDMASQDVALSEAHLDALKRQKRGLMQKLLTGEWRVPA